MMIIELENFLHIRAHDLIILLKTEKPIILDIREPIELDESSIPIAVNIPMNTLLNNMNSLLKKDKLYYLLCHTGQRSHYVTKIISEAGYKVVNVLGGIALMPQFYHQ